MPGPELKKVGSVVDTLWKFCAALAALAIPVAGAFIAGNYQSRTTAVTVLSEREKSESELRASMFSNLIGPLVGFPARGAAESSAEMLRKERILVELLALNFHESFELKPLLLDVYERLPKEEDKDSLRSVARRVIDRQTSELLKGAREKYENPVELSFYAPRPEGQEQKSCVKEDDAYIGGDTRCADSPDGRYSVRVAIEPEDFRGWKFRVNMVIKKGEEYTGRSFTITPFDFPFTDNTMIDLDTRFALVIDNVSDFSHGSEDGEKVVVLKLVWFPEGFVSPRERPINYGELRKTLKLDEAEREKP